MHDFQYRMTGDVGRTTATYAALRSDEMDRRRSRVPGYTPHKGTNRAIHRKMVSMSRRLQTLSTGKLDELFLLIQKYQPKMLQSPFWLNFCREHGIQNEGS